MSKIFNRSGCEVTITRVQTHDRVVIRFEDGSTRRNYPLYRLHCTEGFKGLLQAVQAVEQAQKVARVERCRKAGKARAKQFTPEYQRAALVARNKKYGDVKLSEWGTKGYIAAMKLAGFTDTVYMRSVEGRY